VEWQGKSVLVTGAGGFIGSHLTERLVELGARTRAFVHYNSSGSWGWLDTSSRKDDLEVVAGDITDRDSVRSAMERIEVVFHLAALIAIPYSYRAPGSYLRTNIEGTLNVLQSAQETGVERLVHTSSSEVYGTARYVPIDENHPLQGQSPYSATKIAADKLAEAFYHSYGLPVSVIRPFNTFGPRQSDRAIIPTIISQALFGDEIRLGSLWPTRDFNYVANTVDGFLSVAESADPDGEAINVGSGKEISIEDLARMVTVAIGREVPIVQEEQRVRPEGSEVGRLLADIGKAHRLLNWEPRVGIEEGLGLTIEWIKNNMDRYRTHVYSV
jgi:dTDP-glucose 4,6-dehydratase